MPSFNQVSHPRHLQGGRDSKDMMDFCHVDSTMQTITYPPQISMFWSINDFKIYNVVNILTIIYYSLVQL